MGCDIHFYVEKKVEGKWQPVKGPNRWYKKFDGEGRLSLEGWAYSGRNYSLFALLADVRSYGEENAIDDPRGVPNDMSDTLEEAYQRWDGDGHSHSYFTVSELKEHETELESVSPGFGMIIQKLETLSEGDPDNVRTVFWFDN
jgi:hypothetical protein